jgi:large subunit ribosomal protein L18
MKMKKADRRKRIQQKIRKSVTGTIARPRLSVFRSNKAIYCQLIDDLNGHTLCAASSSESKVKVGTTKIEQAKLVGKLIAEKAMAAKIDSVTFDRGGYLYHGRVKSLAEGAREGGLVF